MQQLIDAVIRKMPGWLRWLLVLPTAFLADLAAQSFYQVVLHAIPMQVIRPYTDELIWRVLAPVVFVIGGVKMAPRYWFQVSCLLLGFKSIIALINIHTLVKYLLDGGSLLAPANVTNAPAWWSLLCHVLFIGFASLMIVIDKNIRKQPTERMSILDF